jgi:hypothetical protein
MREQAECNLNEIVKLDGVAPQAVMLREAA